VIAEPENGTFDETSVQDLVEEGASSFWWPRVVWANHKHIAHFSISGFVTR